MVWVFWKTIGFHSIANFLSFLKVLVANEKALWSEEPTSGLYSGEVALCEMVFDSLNSLVGYCILMDFRLIIVEKVEFINLLEVFLLEGLGLVHRYVV